MWGVTSLRGGLRARRASLVRFRPAPLDHGVSQQCFGQAGDRRGQVQSDESGGLAATRGRPTCCPSSSPEVCRTGRNNLHG
jgi:hypothetical protein